MDFDKDMPGVISTSASEIVKAIEKDKYNFGCTIVCRSERNSAK